MCIVKIIKSSHNNKIANSFDRFGQLQFKQRAIRKSLDDVKLEDFVALVATSAYVEYRAAKRYETSLTDIEQFSGGETVKVSGKP